MSTDLAQSPKWHEDRTEVDPNHPEAIYPHTPGLNLEPAKSVDGPVDRYLPGKWSWGPARSSSDW
jgi:hypothetical protein